MLLLLPATLPHLPIRGVLAPLIWQVWALWFWHRLPHMPRPWRGWFSRPRGWTVLLPPPSIPSDPQPGAEQEQGGG